MLQLDFEGWFQCRLATDPDPTDEPRGVSGTTFALPSEPDLDRIIRLQNPVCPRYPHEDDIGVSVKRVQIDGQPVADHPLMGATVELLDQAKFEQQNFILVTETFQTPIDPFHIKISGNGITLQRKDLWDITQPDMTIFDVAKSNPDLLKRWINTTTIQSPEVAEATGALNYEQYRQNRRQDLIKRREHVSDPIERADLDQRIAAIAWDQTMTGVALAATQFLGLRVDYSFDINGPAFVEDRLDALRGEVGASQTWPITFWFGGYDVDTLCGYMRGQLAVPFRART